MMTASVYELFRSYESEVVSRKQLLMARAQTVLDALKAGIMAHGRMGRYRFDRLNVIFEELAKTPDLVSLQLRSKDGVVIASGGDTTKIPSAIPSSPAWIDEHLIVCDDFVMLTGGGMGRHGQEDMENWVAFPEGTSTLIAVMDASGMYAGIRRDRIQFVVFVFIIVVALSLGVTAILLLLKRTHLAAALEQAHERAQRQEQIAHLGAGLAHETKNPLGIVRGLAQSMRDCNQPDCPRKEYADKILDEVDRVIRGVNDFLALARPKEAVLAPVLLDSFFEQLLPLIQMDASAAGVDVQYCPNGITILADHDLLRRAVLNLLLNAFRASRANGTVTICVECKGTNASITIVDTGCGIAPEDIPQVTAPYFTRAQGGSGLGLTMVEQITNAHGWRLHIESKLGKGTQVSLGDIQVVR